MTQEPILHRPFELLNPPEELLVAYATFQIFMEKNGLIPEEPVTIKLDFYLDEDPMVCGKYYEEIDTWSVHINPNACIPLKNYNFGDHEMSYHGYPVDMSMFGVAIHEFSHLILHNFYPTLFSKFKHTFPQKRLYLTRYTESDPEEELVELIRLYIQNPLFLKLIDIKYYKFIQSQFKSPNPCSDKHAYKFYTEFPKEVREGLEKRFGIVYNIEKERFLSTGEHL